MSDSGAEVMDDSEVKELRAESLGVAMVDSLRYMGSFSERSLKYFDETAGSKILYAKKLPPVPNMLISALHFKEDVRKEYNRVALGEMRQVVAVTGVGKSTTFPAEIANFTGDNGIILSPRPDLSYANGTYLAEKFLKSNYKGISAVQLRSDHVKHPAQGKTLYYDSAPSFFMMLAIYPTLLEKLQIKFILLDESHENIAVYTLAEFLASAGVFSGVKILRVSATKGDVNMESESENKKRKVHPTPADQMELSNIASMTPKSPLHYSRINSKVLLFVPQLSDIANAKSYYEQYDIPTFVHTSVTSSTGLPELAEFLANNQVAVVFTDRVLQTGFTYDFDDAYCCGYTEILRFDLDNKRIELEKVPVSMSERLQRGGRIGRLGVGHFYFADVESRPESKTLSDSSACYLALWCRLFNLDTKVPEVVKFRKYFGDMTHRKAMMLLHCHVHPILTDPYMDMQGNMCHGWEKVFNHAVRKTSFAPTTVSKMDEIQSDWVFQNIYDQRFVDELERIQVPMSVPENWAPFFYAVWKVTDEIGQRWPFRNSFDRRSVLSVVPLDPEARKRTVYRSRKVRDSAATLNLDARKVGRSVVPSVGTTISPVIEDISLHESAFDGGSVRSRAPAVPTLPDKFKALPTVGSSTGFSSEPITQRRGSAAKSVKIVEKAPVQEFHSPGTSVSLSDYRSVQALRLHVEKVFPYDIGLLEMYLSSPARKQLDFERTMDMCDFKVKLHDLSLDMKRRYVISVIRCWNYSVVAVMQLAAKQEKRSFFRSSNRELMGFEKDLESFRQLMATMEVENFIFAVRKSGRHSSVRSILPKFSSTLVDDRVDYIRHCIRVFKVDGQRQGLYLLDNGCVLGVLHVFEHGGTILKPHSAHVIRMAQHDDLVVMGDSTHPNVGLTQLVRTPISGERAFVVTVGEDGNYSVVSDVQIGQSIGKWFHTAQCVPNMSGAAVVAEDDGRLLGLHLGASFVFDGYVSAMVSLADFVTRPAVD